MTKKKPYTFIDLFAGAGGLSEGFIRAGFTPIAHIEMKQDACNTLKTRSAFHYLQNHGQLSIYEDYLKNKKEGTDGSVLWAQVPSEVTDAAICATIGEDTINGIFEKVDSLKGDKTVDIIIGGPPCQAYSVAGRARMGKAVEEDPRNELYKYYVQFLERYQPKMFVFENVLGIITAKRGVPFADLKKLVDELGYDMDAKVQIASEHGVLQNRQRVIIVGWKRNTSDKFGYPELAKESMPYTVMNDLFSDLPIRKAGEGKLCEPISYTRPLSEMEYLEKSGIRGVLGFTTQHLARPTNDNDREIYKIAVEMWRDRKRRLNYAELPIRLQKHKNKETFLNRFSVVNPDGCCHTVVAHIAMDGHYYIYPTPNPTLETVRSITVREAARLQSFPDDYYFEGSRTSALMQIGNAVPVILAQKIAEAIKKKL
jgi:DNA (cytosine-5)-methyltransferase 1